MPGPVAIQRKKGNYVSAASRSSPYWVEEMASDGFIILCGRVPEGEAFIIFSTDPPRLVGLRKIPESLMKAPFRGPVVAMASWMSGSLTEAAVRSKLMEAGLSASDIDAKLEWARQLATTITRQPGAEPVLWWPNLDDCLQKPSAS